MGGIALLILIGIPAGIIWFIFYIVENVPTKKNREKHAQKKELDQKVASENQYILDTLDQLKSINEIKPDISDQELRLKFNSGLYAECILDIMKNMGLKNSVKVTRYSDHKFPRNDCAAFVDIPGNNFGFNSIPFSNQRIQVAIKESATKKYQTFVYVIAHELSHIILHGMNHPLRDSEIATDLFVMISGFTEIMGKGMSVTNYQHYDAGTKTHHHSSTNYGYLSYTQFTTAREYLKTRVDKSTTATEGKTKPTAKDAETLYYTNRGSIAIFQKIDGVISTGDIVSVRKTFNVNDWKTEYVRALDGTYNVFDKGYTAINNRNNFIITVVDGRVTGIVK